MKCAGQLLAFGGVPGTFNPAAASFKRWVSGQANRKVSIARLRGDTAHKAPFRFLSDFSCSRRVIACAGPNDKIRDGWLREH